MFHIKVVYRLKKVRKKVVFLKDVKNTVKIKLTVQKPITSRFCFRFLQSTFLYSLDAV